MVSGTAMASAYLRSRFLRHMVDDEGYLPEVGFSLERDSTPPKLRLYPGMQAYEEPITSGFGGFDFVTTAADGTRVAVEWETGNISSSLAFRS